MNDKKKEKNQKKGQLERKKRWNRKLKMKTKIFLFIIILLFFSFITKAQITDNVGTDVSYQFELIKHRWYGTLIEYEPKYMSDIIFLNIIKLPLYYYGLNFMWIYLIIILILSFIIFFIIRKIAANV